MDFITMPSQAKGKEDYIGIYARVRHKKECKKYALGFCIKKHEWQKIKTLTYQGSAIMTSVCIKYVQFVGILTKVKYVIEKNPESKMIPVLIRSIKAEVLTGNSLFSPEEVSNEDVLLDDYMETYIKELENGTRLRSRQSHKVSSGYIKNISNTLKSIKLYEDVMCSKLTLNDMTMEFRNSYIAFLNRSGIKPNTIAGRMSCIRTIAKAAYLQKLTRCDAFMNPGFVPMGEEVDAVYLTPERVEELRSLDLSSFEVVKEKFDTVFAKKKPRTFKIFTENELKNFNYTRDIFIVGCLVGQRYSDYHRISNDMIISLKEKKFIKLRQEKTGKVVIIPLDTRVKEILDKYGGKLPSIHKDTFNCIIKVLGELLGWTEYPVFDRKEGQNQNKRFCDMMASHTARRTFATNSYAADISLKSIMAITGHASEQSLRKYLKLQAEDKALLALEDFKGFIMEEGMEEK